MPAHATTVAEYCDVLARSRLLPEADVQAARRQWEGERGADADVEGFRRSLVRRKLLTEYQAALVQRGHTEGFFLGGYAILDRIGKGKAAGVYKARHESGQVVALKVLPASKARDPATLARFQREGRLSTQLDHPNVVRAFQVGQAGGVHFIVMEHLDGETLDEVLARRKRLPTPEAVRLVHQALRGLQHLFERRTVHRDLKPANLMVTPPPPPAGPDTTLNATVKILDVGIGRELFDEDAPPRPEDPALSDPGLVLGTPTYLAPEQARDPRAADVRSDIYSLGCVLFHLLAGRPPFTDSTVMALMVRHATEPPPPLASVAPGVPAGLQAVFDRLTAKKPEDRYQTPAAAAEALRPFLPSGAGTAVATPVAPAYRAWLASESSEDLGEPKPAAPLLAAPPARPARPLGKTPREMPPVRPAEAEPEINVELVAMPVPEPAREPERRSLLDPSRRDLLMFWSGVGLALAAVGIGYGLAKLFRQAGGPSEPKEEPDSGGK